MAEEKEIPVWADSELVYLGKMGLRSNAVYIIIVLFIIGIIASLPFLKFDLSVKAGGIIRPMEERIEIRSMIHSRLKNILVKDGDLVNKGDLLFVLDDSLLQDKISFYKEDLERKKLYAEDYNHILLNNPDKINAPHIRRQFQAYKSKIKELQIGKNQAASELHVEKVLLAEKASTPKRVKELEYKLDIAAANLKSYSDMQYQEWEIQFQKLQEEIAVIEREILRLEAERKYYYIYSPYTGTVESLTARYSGSTIEAGQVFCIISPKTALIAECFIPNKNIGFLYPGQECLFQVDAYHFNRFGTIEGKILSIDQDFMLIDNIPSYRVKCSFNSDIISLPGGGWAELKKGMTFTARFKIARRSAWDLLYEQLSDWLNPNATAGL